MKVLKLLAFTILAGTSQAEEETPLQYLVNSLRVGTNGGSVVETKGKLEWPTILKSKPKVVPVGHSHGYDAGITIEWRDDSWKDFLAANGFKRDTTLDMLAKDIPFLRRFLGPAHVTYSRWIDLPRLGLVIIYASRVDEGGEHPRLHLIVGHSRRYFVEPSHEQAEQNAPEQPATAGESK